MAKLNAEKRNALPSKDFVQPGKRAYPIPDASHARNALARSSGKPVHAAVEKKVESKFPGIKVDAKGNVQSKGGRPRSQHTSSDGFVRRGK